MGERQVYKGSEVQDEGARLVLTQLGPEEEFAGNVLKSLKEKISEARQDLQDLEAEIQQKEEEARTAKDEILSEAEDEAEEIRNQAQQEADELIQSKQQEVESAREEGFQEGYEDGHQEARKETAELIEHAESILEEARRERHAYVENHEDSIIQLAVTLAERVLTESVEIDEDLVRQVVRDAVDDLREVREITLVLHPEDLKIIRDIVDELHGDHPSLESIDLSENDRLQRGGCRIRTDFGDIDATLSGILSHYESILSDLDDGLVDDEEEATEESEE